MCTPPLMLLQWLRSIQPTTCGSHECRLRTLQSRASQYDIVRSITLHAVVKLCGHLDGSATAHPQIVSLSRAYCPSRHAAATGAKLPEGAHTAHIPQLSATNYVQTRATMAIATAMEAVEVRMQVATEIVMKVAVLMSANLRQTASALPLPPQYAPLPLQTSVRFIAQSTRT